VQIRNAHNHWVVGRLAEGVTPQAADDELDAIAASIKQQFPDQSGAVAVNVKPLYEEIVGDSRRPLWTLMIAATLVLLVGCVNVASHLLARGATRRPELAVRRAIGAGRGRLVMQLLTESLLLAAAGAVAGLLLALAMLRLLRRIAADRIPRLYEIGLEPGVLLFCFVTIVFAALLFGLLPALRVTRHDEALAAVARAGGRSARAEVWRGLVGVEVALSVILLVGTGLLVRSMVNIFEQDTGFDRDGVVTVEFSLPSQEYGENPARMAFLRRLRDQLSAIPGVSRVGLVNALPLRPGFKTGPVVVPPYTDVADPDEWDAFMRWRVADAGYFETMGIELREGRLFSDADTEDAPGVALVSKPLAERLWPGEDPLGKKVRATWDFRGEDLTVVGVVEEARHWAEEPGAQTQLYVPWMQRPEHAGAMVAVVRSSLPPAQVAGSARRVVHDIDPRVLADVSTLNAQLVATLTDRTFNLVVLGGFAVVALLLSLAGIYGVVAYSVARRTREIGIRLALGARPAKVRALLQRTTMVAAIAGALLGCAAAAGLSRLIAGLLYGVEPIDAFTLVAAPLLFLAVAAMASYLPARRSTRVDPVITMRAE
jgi:predicted permease